jgi:hypothetical protein
MGKYVATRLQLIMFYHTTKNKIKIGIVLKAKFEIYIVRFK